MGKSERASCKAALRSATLVAGSWRAGGWVDVLLQGGERISWRSGAWKKMEPEVVAVAVPADALGLILGTLSVPPQRASPVSFAAELLRVAAPACSAVVAVVRVIR